MISRSLSEASASSSRLYQRHTTHSETLLSHASKTIDHGSIRLYSSDGQRSTVATLTLSTTAGQIAQNYKVDSLYLQTGNFRIRKLLPEARPLEIYTTFINSIGFDMEAVRNFSSQEIMKNIIAFYLGIPSVRSSNARSEILMTECDVRRGRLVHKWSRCRCILYDGGVKILRGGDEGEMVSLARKRIDVYESRRGRCLRIQDSASLVLLLFSDEELLYQWLYKCQQGVQSSYCDLSDRRLTLLPGTVFSAPDAVRRLNLRRNSLTLRNDERAPLFGFLDDLSRLRHLQVLDLSFNGLVEFPPAIADIQNLEILNISSNRIESLPPSCSKLKGLTSLDLSNNRLSTLPNQLVECTSLRALNLSFNKFLKIPLVLSRLDMVKSWQLAGNYIETVDHYGSDLQMLQKIDLRRNNLESTFRLPVGSYDHLVQIDLRDNQKLSVVHLTTAPGLQVVLCSRLQLTSIHLNGQSLTHLYADHNLLDSIVVMPIPANLQVLDIAHNLFETLPDWICDLAHLKAIKANHNRLVSLPSRLFCMSSLRLLCLFNNEISALPPAFEDCVLETLLIQNNCIEELPADTFKALSRLRQLNVSFNELRSLPLPSRNSDWNKLQVLRAAHNNLDETVVPIIVLLKRLRVLDLSSNRLRYFDDSALSTLTLLEDLNISSNVISSVSSAIPQLPVLTHFRAHSNAILNMPELSQSLTIQLVDLSSNQIAHFPPSMASAPALKSLDVSCNPLMQIDSGTISRSRRKPVSVVDVGTSTDKLQFGFSETTGNRNRLCIRRVCKKSVFGLVDGGSNYELPKAIMGSFTKKLEDMPDIDLKKALISTHLTLGESGEQLGASVLLAHVQTDHLTLVSSGTIGVAVLSKGNISQLDTGGLLEEEDRARLRKHGLWIDENNLINGLTSSIRQLGMYHLHPAVSPSPVVIDGSIEGIDAIVIASKALWEHLSCSEIARITNSTVNPQLSAKRLQDALQSCDFLGNSSIIVIRLPKPEVKFDRSKGSTRPDSSLQAEKQPNLQSEALSKPSTSMDESIERRVLERRSEDLDEGYLTGRQLYDRILAEEVGQRPSSSLSGAPPDPTSEEEQQPTPTPRYTTLPPSYDEFKESRNYSLGYATKEEGLYNVAEHTRRFDKRLKETKSEEIATFKTTHHCRETSSAPQEDRILPRPLEVIREISESTVAELAIDEPHSFSHISLDPNASLLTPMEETLSSRYRFEYAKSSLQENLKLSRSSALDL